MPPWILPVIAAVSVAIPTILLLLKIGSPFIRGWLKANVDKQNLERLQAALKGAAVVVTEIAKRTPGFTLDDGFAQVLSFAADEVGAAFIEQYGKAAGAYLGALQAKPDNGIDLGKGDVASSMSKIQRAASGIPVGVSVGYLGKLDLKARP